MTFAAAGLVLYEILKDNIFILHFFILLLLFFLDKVTISGLAAEDYPSLRDIDVNEFAVQRIRPFPQQLTDQLNSWFLVA